MKPSKAEEFGLRHYCKSYFSFKAQFAILSLCKSTFSPWFEQILLSLEYIQLLSLTIFIHPSVSHISNPNNNRDPLLFEIIAYSLKLANPSYLLSFESSNSTTTSVLAIILAFTLFKYVMLSWAIYTSFFSKDPSSLLKSIWRCFFTLQGRVICCFITSFWVKTIQEISFGNFHISWINNGAIISISIILVILEYLLSFLLETQFCSFIPTKSYLSSKNLDMQIITLTQKFVIQIIQLCVYSNTAGSIWILVILNLIISLMREYTFFKTLPLYNYKSLQHQGDLLAIVFSFHLTHFLQHILISSDYEGNIDFRFLIILWILFGAMISLISRALLKRIHVHLLTTYPDDQHQIVERLLHKIFTTKHLIQTRRIRNQVSQQVEMKYFLGIVQMLHLKEVFNLESISFQEPISLDTLDQKEIKEIFLAFLEDLALQFPDNSLIKLNLAHRNYKSEKFDAEIIKILSDLQKSTWSIYYTSSVLLLHDIKTAAITGLDDEVELKNRLNIIKYIETQSLMEDLNNEILKHIELKKDICNNIVQNTCDLEIIYQNAQIIHKSKIQTQNKINKLINYMPEYYFTPFLMLAEYSLSLNYSPADFHKYYENYLRRSSKFAMEYDAKDLCEENLYQDNNAFLIISLENGCIAYSTESLQTICGPDRTKYNGTHITRLFPHGLRNQYSEIFREIREKGQSNFTNKVSNSYLIHKEGYLIEADLFIQVHPYISQNLYIDMIIRPRNSYQDVILMNKAGKIEGATRDISKSLGIEKSLFNNTFGSSIHIKQISEELSQLNNAFNVMNRGNYSALNAKFGNLVQPLNRFRMIVKKTLEKTQALQLYDVYDSGTKLIQLKSLSFRCKISSLHLKTSSFNLITLQKFSLKHNGIVESVNSRILPAQHKRESDRSRFKETLSPIYPETVAKDVLTPRSHTTQLLETEENLLAPPTSSRFFLKTSPRPALAELTEINEDIKDGLNSSLNGAGSHVETKSAQMVSLSKSFQRAISTKSYQDSFSFLCFIFYGVIILTLVCEIVLKTVLDDTMSNLILKTNLLNSAQLRTFHLTLIQNSARGTALQFAGTLAAGDAGIPDDELKSGLYIMLASLVVMEESNNIIMNNIASESDEIKQMLFQRDIEIIGTIADPSALDVQYVNSFQHTNILDDATRLLNNLHPFISETGYNAFVFVTYNSANGFLAKNQEIIQAFLNSVNQQKEELQTMINLFVIILPLLLAGIVLLLSIIIWKQYAREKSHLLAFLKLNPFMISHILNNLKSMEKRLRFQEKSDEEEVPRLIYQFHHFPKYTSYHKTQDLKSVRYEKMQKRYFGYIFKTLLYISLLIIIVIVNYIFISKATNKIYRQQKQIQYANDISTAAMVSYIAEAEAFGSNNTNYIMRKTPVEIWEEGIQEISDIQTNIYSAFQLENGDYDPDVKAVLFEEAVCDKLISAAVPFCVSLKSLGQPTPMFSTLTLYQNFLVSKLEDFKAVDKSSILVMIGVAIVNLSYILAAAVVTSGHAQLINQIISRNLTNSVDDLYHLAAIILTIFSLTLAVVSVLIWFQILRKVKEVNNDFKKVLAVLPPNIILSSFLLKTFLNKTSNMAQKL